MEVQTVLAVRKVSGMYDAPHWTDKKKVATKVAEQIDAAVTKLVITANQHI